MTINCAVQSPVGDSAEALVQRMTSIRGGSIAVDKASRSQGGVLVATKSVSLGDGELLTKASHHTFILTLSGSSMLTGSASSDGHHYEGADHAGALSFWPQGIERRSWQKASRLQVATLHIDETSPIAREAGFRGGDHPSLTNGYDPLIEAVMRELSGELADGPPASMMIDHAAALVLFRMTARGRTWPIAAVHTLSRRQRERIDMLIQTRLGESIGLDDLAAEAGMSLAAFSRSFKATVGTSPYRYLTLARIERARSLLIQSGLSLAQIAFETGFASPGQLTRHFHAIVGLPPARFRSEHGRRNRHEID